MLIRLDRTALVWWGKRFIHQYSEVDGLGTTNKSHTEKNCNSTRHTYGLQSKQPCLLWKINRVNGISYYTFSFMSLYARAQQRDALFPTVCTIWGWIRVAAIEHFLFIVMLQSDVMQCTCNAAKEQLSLISKRVFPKWRMAIPDDDHGLHYSSEDIFKCDL